ncbi:hypothetical protein TNCV_3391751 [Trichonephila clavipes]|nr:hypothetical protein TNCV_3391751 [Trichonephila clavipes]
MGGSNWLFHLYMVFGQWRNGEHLPPPCKVRFWAPTLNFTKGRHLRQSGFGLLRTLPPAMRGCKFKKDELRSIADELKLVVPDNAKALDLRELIQESEIYKNDKEAYQAIVDCVLEEINDRRNEDENRRNENENRLEIEKIKLSHVKTCCAKNCFCGKPHNRLIHFPKPGKESVALNQTVQRSVLNPLADVFGGPGGSNCVVPPQVSGSVGDEVRDNNIHCGLIRDSDLNTTLRSFWELESIGVKNENCSSEEDVSFEMFKQRVHFKNGRYEVELRGKEIVMS